jgi:hypothetical protein
MSRRLIRHSACSQASRLYRSLSQLHKHSLKLRNRSPECCSPVTSNKRQRNNISRQNASRSDKSQQIPRGPRLLRPPNPCTPNSFRVLNTWTRATRSNGTLKILLTSFTASRCVCQHSWIMKEHIRLPTKVRREGRSRGGTSHLNSGWVRAVRGMK